MTTMNTLPSNDLLSAMNPAAAKGASETGAAQDRFMKLLVTQMKNQDPLNPLDNAQVTGQLAQLSTVNGVNKLNDTMQAMVQSMQGGQAMQAAALIGRSVLVPGSSLALSAGKASFGAELTEPVDQLQLTISDAAGHPLKVMDLGPQNAGTVALQWDGSYGSGGGSAPDGRYVFQLNAIRGGQKISVQPLVMSSVSSVATAAGTGSHGGVSLQLSNGQSGVTMSDVRRIL